MERREPETALAEAPETAERLAICIVPEPLPPLPLGWRIGIFIAGWALILIGVAGLVLPGLQGILTILLGAALLSLDNELVYRGLRRALVRWPRAWQRVERFRARAHARLHRFRKH
jgi:hypothetical protein